MRTFDYFIEDCHGPSGLAMTSVSPLLCAFVAMDLILKNKANFEIAAVAALLRNDNLANFGFYLEQNLPARRYMCDNRLF